MSKDETENYDNAKEAFSGIEGREESFSSEASYHNDWGASEDKFQQYGWTIEYANDSEEGFSQKA